VFCEMKKAMVVPSPFYLGGCLIYGSFLYTAPKLQSVMGCFYGLQKSCLAPRFPSCRNSGKHKYPAGD